MKTTASRAWSIGALYLLAAISNQIVSQASSMPDLSKWTWIQWMTLVNAIALTIRSYIDRTPAQVAPRLADLVDEAIGEARPPRGGSGVVSERRNLPPDPPFGTGIGSRFPGNGEGG